MTYDLPLYIATAKSSNSAKWKNQKTTWSKVIESISQTVRTKETLKQYFSYTKDKQDSIKDIGGFVGGKLLSGTAKIKGKDVTYSEPYGWRRKGFVDHRQLVALDVDFGDMDVWLNFRLLEIAGAFYTTHKHQPDEPRIRILFPLDRPVSPDEYECIARIVASWLNIEVFDDTTYQSTRLMYYPSTAKDGEFLFDTVDAPILCADNVLKELDDWTDVTTWPISSREKEVRKTTNEKVENPCHKHGIVGAFCRSFTIEEAIAQFLPEKYVPCEELGEDRYSYTKGSTAGGLIIYDHKHAYSHHNTDPAGGKLSNAFDLVRLHKFGELDEKIKEGTEVTKLPSFKAMADFAQELTEVKRDIVRERKAELGAEYEDLIEEIREKGENDEWVGQLEMDGKRIKDTIDNVVKILQNDEYLKGCFGYNEFEHRETILKAVPWDKPGKKYPRAMIDADDAELRLYLERCYGVTKVEKINDGVTITIRANTYHPIQDYLNSCVWDGINRLDELIIDTLGGPDSTYTRTVTRKFFVAAVARIFKPGIKFDNMLVTVGDQGVGKSTVFNYMGRAWFSDSVTTVSGKEALESIQGSWLIEMGELTGLRQSEVNAVKHFISKSEDRYRVAYGKRVEYFPRQCVFAGTTNEDDFLRDVTGNRRYWVVNCKGGISKLPVWEYLDSKTVNLIWAEAVHYYKKGETLYLSKELEIDAKLIQDDHLEKDDRTGLIIEYLSRLMPENWDKLTPYERKQWLDEESNGDKGIIERRHVCILEVWAECLGKNSENITRKDSMEIARVLKSLRHWRADGLKRIKWYGVQKQFIFTGIKKDGYN